MELLIQSQLQGNCKLEVPEGLKDLMADISREVLRAQPENLYRFISEYLSALLVTREHLTIACRVCHDAAENVCLPTLVEELKIAGFQEEHAQIAANIIFKYFEDGEVKEEKLINKLTKEIPIQANQLPVLQTAIQKAFTRQKQKEILIDENSSKKVDDDISRAVDHTMKIYEKTKPSEQQYIAMATRIQAAYKGYGVRRYTNTTEGPLSDDISDSLIESSFPNREHFKPEDKDKGPIKPLLKSLSSHSLAGSMVNLPRYKPYCVSQHSPIEEIENATFDYIDPDDDNEAKIIFYNPNQTPEEETKNEVTMKGDVMYIEEEAGYADDESNTSVEDEAIIAASDDGTENNAQNEKVKESEKREVVLKESRSFLV